MEWTTEFETVKLLPLEVKRSAWAEYPLDVCISGAVYSKVPQPQTCFNGASASWVAKPKSPNLQPKGQAVFFETKVFSGFTSRCMMASR